MVNQHIKEYQYSSLIHQYHLEAHTFLMTMLNIVTTIKYIGTPTDNMTKHCDSSQIPTSL